MRMFIVHTRPIPGCASDEALSIVEVECEKVSHMHDPSVGWLPADEFKVRILKPEFLYETQDVFKNGAKEKVQVPPIYYSHALFKIKEDAVRAASELVVEEFQFEIRKGKKSSYSEEDVATRCAKIKEHLLISM